MTAEAAIALPALVITLAAGVWGLGVASLQARCTVAARSAALAAARGEPTTAVAARVREALGAGASMALSPSGDTVSVRVTAPGKALGLLPAWPVSVAATASYEPGESAP